MAELLGPADVATLMSEATADRPVTTAEVPPRLRLSHARSVSLKRVRTPAGRARSGALAEHLQELLVLQEQQLDEVLCSGGCAGRVVAGVELEVERSFGPGQRSVGEADRDLGTDCGGEVAGDHVLVPAGLG
jgi:hypothetical protein